MSCNYQAQADCEGLRGQSDRVNSSIRTMQKEFLDLRAEVENGSAWPLATPELVFKVPALARVDNLLFRMRREKGKGSKLIAPILCALRIFSPLPMIDDPCLMSLSLDRPRGYAGYCLGKRACKNLY